MKPQTWKTANGVFALVALSLVVVVEAFQRDRRKSRLKHLRDHWNANYCGALRVVPQKDGTYHTADGAHRDVILNELHGPNTLIMVQLVESFKDFGPLNDGLKVSPNDDFKVMLACGEQPYKRVAYILKQNGIGIHYGSRPKLGCTAAPAAFLGLEVAMGTDFAVAVKTLADCFTREEDGQIDPGCLSADFIRGYKSYLVGEDTHSWEEIAAGLQNSPLTATEIAAKGRKQDTTGTGRWKEIADILGEIVTCHNRPCKKAA